MQLDEKLVERNVNMWLKREKSDESVSLTVFVLSFIAFLVASILEVAGVVKSTGPLFELFGSTMALYFGRRISIRGKVFISEVKKDESTPNA